MANSRRLQKINKTLMKEISEVIYKEVKDPRMKSLVTVLDANISNDMRNVKVYISIYGRSDISNLKTLEALQSASGFISSVVSKSLRLKYAPEIHFEKTTSVSDSVEMSAKIKELTDNEDFRESDTEEDN